MRKTLPRLLFLAVALLVPMAAHADPITIFIAAEAALGAAAAGSIAAAYSAAGTFLASYGAIALGVASAACGSAASRRDARRKVAGAGQ